MSSLLSQVFSLVLKIFQLPVSENRLPLTAATYSSRSAKKSPSPPGFLLFSSFCQTPQIILKLLFQFRRQRLRMDPVAHSIPQQYFPHTASRHLYCAPVEFAVQPDCRPPARYFPGDITVNPGGLQYICRAPWISDPYKLIRSSVPCLPCPRISHQYPPGCSLHSTFQGSIPRSGFPCRTEPHPSPDRQSLSDPAVPGYVPACPP